MIFSVGKRVSNFAKVKIYFYINKYKSGTHTVDNLQFNDTSKDEIKRFFYKSGALKLECCQRQGKLEGIANLYHENGKIKAREFYKNDVLHGLSKWYYESGELKSEKYYKDGVVISMKEFDKNGNIIKTEK